MYTDTKKRKKEHSSWIEGIGDAISSILDGLFSLGDSGRSGGGSSCGGFSDGGGSSCSSGSSCGGGGCGGD